MYASNKFMCNKYKDVLDRCHKPYDATCYDWDLVAQILMLEYHINKYDAVDIVNILRQEIYG